MELFVFLNWLPLRIKIKNIVKKSVSYTHLIKDLQKQDFDDYYKTVDSFATKLLIPPFNREYMRMNGLIMQGRKGKVEEQFDLMLNMRMNQKQEIDIVMKAFRCV